MMKLKYLIGVLAMTVMFSCGSDDSLTDDIVGTWLLETLNGQCAGESPISFQANNDGCVVAPDGEELCLELILTENMSYTVTIFGDTETGTYTVNETASTVTLCQGTDCFDINYANNKLLVELTEEDCTQDFTLAKK